MADTEFIFFHDRMHSFFEEKLSDCVIAKDDELPISGPPDSQLLEQMSLRSQQLFVKHASFATDNFKFKLHRHADGTGIFVVDQFAGSGHLKIMTLPLRDATSSVFRMTIAYQSFFVSGDAHISPSSELKRFYSSVISAAKKRTQRFELWQGRSMWFQSGLLKSYPEILETVRASFHRS
ncbi:hypothetical protein LP421_11745 [Rhizobium sp. RCAM05350]|nr:hypothetical protein LP421_11745 [Rhizobium sp. RCAM05350]